MSLHALPPLREVIAAHGLDARKGLGQHFLLDGNITAKIVRAAGDLTGVSVIEIGPGPGGLTRALLDSAATRVIAIERDQRCLAALASLQAAAGDRLALIHADALTVDAAGLGEAPRAIIANLPYNVGTALLTRWLNTAPAFRSLTLMFQREVAERLVAAPGSGAYGRLSVLCQWLCQAEIAFHLPARAFVPPPKVASSVVHLVPRSLPLDAPSQATVSSVTAAAFGQRRKMLRTALKPLGDAEWLLEQAGIDGTRRAESLGIDAFLALARALEARGSAP